MNNASQLAEENEKLKAELASLNQRNIDLEIQYLQAHGTVVQYRLRDLVAMKEKQNA